MGSYPAFQLHYNCGLMFAMDNTRCHFPPSMSEDIDLNQVSTVARFFYSCYLFTLALISYFQCIYSSDVPTNQSICTTLVRILALLLIIFIEFFIVIVGIVLSV